MGDKEFTTTVRSIGLIELGWRFGFGFAAGCLSLAGIVALIAKIVTWAGL